MSIDFKANFKHTLLKIHLPQIMRGSRNAVHGLQWVGLQGF